MRAIGLSIILVSLTGMVSESSWSPPKLVKSTIPSPFAAADGEYALFDVRISREGLVVAVTELGTGASFADRMRSHILSWRFEPATSDRTDRIPSSVLVAVVSRAPKLAGAIGPWPKTPERVETSEQIPFPKRILVPPFPPHATREGIVLLEVEIDDDGRVADGKVVHSSNGYDGVCLDTVEEWEIRPARHQGDEVATQAYILCNFRPPPKLMPFE